MSARTLDVVLKDRGDSIWVSDALKLPQAHVASIVDGAGKPVAFDMRGSTVTLKNQVAPIIARIELPEALVEVSALDRAKVELDREKLAVEERGGRRTLWVSLATAVVSAAATIGVALVTNLGGSSAPKAAPAPTAYRDLVDCRESLNVLGSLTNLDPQTLQNLKEAIRRHVDTCKDRLDIAIAASPP